MISVVFHAEDESGEVVGDETIFFEGPTVYRVEKSMRIESPFGDKRVTFSFTFDPPLVAEIPLGPDEQPDRELRP